MLFHSENVTLTTNGFVVKRRREENTDNKDLKRIEIKRKKIEDRGRWADKDRHTDRQTSRQTGK